MIVDGQRCAGCGYWKDAHGPDDRCPLCACGEMPGFHRPIGQEHGCPCGCSAPPGSHGIDPALGVTPALWAGMPCPGKRSEATGRWLLLRRGSFRALDAASPRRDWCGMQRLLSEAELKAALTGATRREPEGPRTPQVPARPPLRPEEIAGGGKNAQATKLGRTAMAADWSVSALYWRDAGGVEGCGVWLAKDPFRALALWKRAAGQVGAASGWLVDIAYAWRTDVERIPTKLTHTDLGRLIK